MSFASEVKNELCRVPVSRHCCAVAEDPCMADIGILASLDPIAVDQAEPIAEAHDGQPLAKRPRILINRRQEKPSLFQIGIAEKASLRDDGHPGILVVDYAPTCRSGCRLDSGEPCQRLRKPVQTGRRTSQQSAETNLRKRALLSEPIHQSVVQLRTAGLHLFRIEQNVLAVAIAKKQRRVVRKRMQTETYQGQRIVVRLRAEKPVAAQRMPVSRRGGYQSGLTRQRGQVDPVVIDQAQRPVGHDDQIVLLQVAVCEIGLQQPQSQTVEAPGQRPEPFAVVRAAQAG